MKILIIDDEPDILELMAEEFKYHGYDIEVASSGNEAIEKLKESKFDLIVSDYKMPNGNGMSVLNFITTQLEIQPKFFFVSGQADVSIDECLKKGATHFFAKPFDLDELIKIIEQFIR